MRGGFSSAGIAWLTNPAIPTGPANLNKLTLYHVDSWINQSLTIRALFNA